MNVNLIEDKIGKAIRCSINNILNEGASTLLYHFLNFDSFKKIINTNSFTPSYNETHFNNGKNYMSFSRTKTFREGWPIIMYGNFGKGDDWCAIRLTIDGNKIRQKPNFKVNNKQYNMSVKPFDWAYKYHNNGDQFSFADETNGIFANNGKEWMMQSDDYYNTYLPINFGKNDKKSKYVNAISDKQGHPFSQSEDRLTTSSNTIPNALSYILRIDILLLPYAFNDDNLTDRTELFNIIKSNIINDKIHVYKSMKDLEMNRNELTNYNVLLKKQIKRYKNPIPDEEVIKRDF